MFRLETFDPRVKMMLMLCLSTYAMLVEDLAGLAAALLLTTLILIVGGENGFRVLFQAKMAMGMVLFILIIQCTSIRSGSAIISIYGISLITNEGLQLGVMLSLRLMILIVSALILLNGEPRDYLLAMVQCKVPYEIAFMVMVGIHFFPILKEEAANIYYSVQLRGTEIEKAAIRKKLEAYLSISLPILVCAMEKARVMTIAMESRCFRIFPYRTYMRKLRLTRADTGFLILFPVLAVLGILWFDL